MPSVRTTWTSIDTAAPNAKQERLRLRSTSSSKLQRLESPDSVTLEQSSINRLVYHRLQVIESILYSQK